MAGGESNSFSPDEATTRSRTSNQGDLTIWLILSVLAVTAGSSFQFGYNTGVLTGVSGFMEDFYNQSFNDRKGGDYMSEDKLRWLWSTTVSIYAVGGAFGALVAGYLSDILGRKGALILNNVFSVSASLMMGLSQIANNYEMVIMGRIVIGFSVGISITIVPLYLAEISPVNYRGAIGTCHQLAITIGILIAQVFGLYVFNNSEDWPLCLALTGVFGLGGGLLLLICPESPRWLLINQGDEDKARAAMVKIRGSNDVEKEIEEIKEEHRHSIANDEGKTTMLDVLRLKESWWKMPLIISIVLHAGQQFSGINAVMFYATEIYEQAKMDPDAIALATVGNGLINVLMTVVAVYVVDRAGRRALMLYPYAAMVFVTAIITLSLNLDGEAWQWVTLTFIYLYIIGFAIGPGPMPFVVVPELWAQGPRPAAMSLAVQCNWWSTFLVGLAFPFMQEGIGGYSFLVFTFFLALTTAFTYFFVPETKNKTFEEITSKFKREAIKSEVNGELESHRV